MRTLKRWFRWRRRRVVPTLSENQIKDNLRVERKYTMVREVGLRRNG